jgi:hypothetical protein
VLTSLLSSWTLLRDLHQLIPAMTGQAARAYAALPATQFSGPLWLWTGIEHPMLLKFVHQDVALVVVVLLWLFPLAGLLWSRPRSRSRAAVIVFAAAACGGTYFFLFMKSLAAPPPLVAHWQVAGAVLVQALLALGVALAARSFRIVWGLLAAFAAGAWSLAGDVDTALQILVLGSFMGIFAALLAGAIRSTTRPERET